MRDKVNVLALNNANFVIYWSSLFQKIEAIRGT